MRVRVRVRGTVVRVRVTYVCCVMGSEGVCVGRGAGGESGFPW